MPVQIPAATQRFANKDELLGTRRGVPRCSASCKLRGERLRFVGKISGEYEVSSAWFQRFFCLLNEANRRVVLRPSIGAECTIVDSTKVGVGAGYNPANRPFDFHLRYCGRRLQGWFREILSLWSFGHFGSAGIGLRNLGPSGLGARRLAGARANELMGRFFDERNRFLRCRFDRFNDTGRGRWHLEPWRIDHALGACTETARHGDSAHQRYDTGAVTGSHTLRSFAPFLGLR